MKNNKKYPLLLMFLVLVGCTFCYVHNDNLVQARIADDSPLALMARGDFDGLSAESIPVEAQDVFADYIEFSEKQKQAHLKTYQEYLDKIIENYNQARWRGALLVSSRGFDFVDEAKAELEKDLEEKAQENWTKALAEMVSTHSLRERFSDMPGCVEDNIREDIIANAIAIAEKYQEQDKGMDAYTKVFGLLEILDREKYDYSSHYDKLVRQTVLESTYVSDPNSENIPWQEKRKDINADLLQMALLNMRTGYVQDPDFKAMTLKGLDYLITFAQTPKLYDVFEALKDEEKRNIWIENLTDLKAQNKEIADDKYDVRYSLINIERVLDLNKKTIDLSENIIIAEFAEGIFDAVDSYSHIIWPADVEAFMKDMKSEFSGIGVVIRKNDDGFLTVDSLLTRDSEAYRAGLNAGDIILNVDGQEVKNYSVEKSVGMITGPSGTEVTLTIEREGVEQPWDVTVTRRSVNVPTVYGLYRDRSGNWQYMVDEQNGIGYVRLTRFSDDTTANLKELLSELKKQKQLKSLILDLRNNGGGYLHEAVSIVDAFVDDGNVVSAKYRDNLREEIKKASPKNTFSNDMPLVVLVNSMSASASEIVSGALKDHHRALVIGSQTFGKGSVQSVYGLSRDSIAQMKMTIAYYYLPEGRRVHRDPKDKVNKDYGVFPNRAVELTGEQFKEFIEVQRAAGTLYRDDLPVDKQSWKIYTPEEMLQSDPQLEMAVLCLRAGLLHRNAIAGMARN